MGKVAMNEELRLKRVEQYGSFLYCPIKDTHCFARYTDQECEYDSCILDDPEYQKLQQKIIRNRKKREEQKKTEAEAFVAPSRPARATRAADAWEEIHKVEARAQELYRKNKPKLADGLMAEALYMRKKLISEGMK